MDLTELGLSSQQLFSGLNIYKTSLVERLFCVTERNQTLLNFLTVTDKI